ncbi:MAG: creatininase family protein [Pseudomonadota bacterium]
MRLDLATWGEVEHYLALSDAPGILLPVGSTEQHGPMGLIGTDALCAEAIARGAAEAAGAYVAPTLAYTPAPFNAAFPGTISVAEATFRSLVADIFAALGAQGFRRIYVLNAHGANLAPLRRVADRVAGVQIRLRSWWAFKAVNALREEYYGPWEGLHATPSEVAITQDLYRIVPEGAAADPPRALDAAEIRARAGDRHGTAERHRAEFPDGRVGAHSALARPEHGAALLAAAVEAVTEDYRSFLQGPA